MRCPECGRIQRLTKKEKAIAIERGEYKFWCTTCGTEMIAHRYDVDVVEMRKHNREIGICSNCGCRPATKGFSTCAHCREYNRTHKGYEPLYLWDNIEDSKKKKPEYSIEELSKIAHDKGMSYGELVAIMEGRKKETKDLD